MAKMREKYLDVAKFVAIFLVIVLHVRDYAGDETAYAGTPWLENMSSVFGVAVFFAISGYLSRGLMQSQDVHKLFRRVVVLLWPLVPIVCVREIENVLLYGVPLIPACGWIRFFFTVGWFFFCLALCETLTFASFVLARRGAVRLAVSLGVVFLLLWLAPVGLFHALEMIPFYWFGLFVWPRLLAWKGGDVVGPILAALALVGFVVFGDFTSCGLSYRNTTTHLLDFSLRGTLLLFARQAIGLISVAGGLLTIRLLVRWAPFVGRLSCLGTQTLGVFYIHMLVLSGYYACVGWTGGGLAGRVGIALSVFFISQGLTIVSHRLKIVRAILWSV